MTASKEVGGIGMNGRIILLVEDNPTDEALTLRAFKKNNIANEVVVAHDGVEALDYLFGTGSSERLDPLTMPAVVLLDLRKFIPAATGALPSSIAVFGWNRAVDKDASRMVYTSTTANAQK